MVDYTPNFYRTHRQFINCVEFLGNREWELALNRLIGLADSVQKSYRSDKANYCSKQIKRNAEHIKSKAAFVWTTIQFDDTYFQQGISEKLEDEWATERREKDKVQELLAKNGVYF
jgi:LPS O-antigen subunit length determinant protein (WzzB/FepE family)